MLVDDEVEKTHILIVDPEMALREQLERVLNNNESAEGNFNNLNFIISACSSPFEAVEIIQTSVKNTKTYQLAIIEINLPNPKTGLELITDIWKLEPDMHVIICTKNNQLSWEDIMSTVGQSDQLLIIKKPADDLEFHQAVHAMVRKWQLSKQSQNIMLFMDKQIQARTQEIESANKQLLQSEKLAAVGQLAAGVAHEINTPAQYVSDNIQAIQGFFVDLTELIDFYKSLLIKQDNKVVDEIRHKEEEIDLEYILADMPLAIEQTQDGIQQISRIVQAMKGFSHMGGNKIATIDINNALENTLIVSKSSYKFIADIERIYTESPMIECYPSELNQVFLNLIVNAAHAIEESNKGQGKITIKTEQNQQHVIISITDTGLGIPEAIQNHIFDPFFTTKEVGKGSGQGLNIAYRIIQEQHSGTLIFNTVIGEGSTFIVTLPKYRA